MAAAPRRVVFCDHSQSQAAGRGLAQPVGGYTGLSGRQNQGSTGLGLHLCRQITDRLGHSLRLESDGPRRGTRALLGLASAALEVE